MCVWYTYLLATYGIIQSLAGNTLACSIVTTAIATVRIVRYMLSQMLAKTGFVPPVYLRSECANIIWMELKYFLKGS
jgi:hypothetical protein